MPEKWVRIYSDRLAEIYVRNVPENAEFLKNILLLKESIIKK
jgi:hypothetical protein